MFYTDDHVHSTFSLDGRQTVEEIARRALALGLPRLTLTEHIEPHHPSPAWNTPPDFGGWFAEIERVRALVPQVQLKAGLEIGDNAPYRQEIWETLDALPLDFRLLSLHLVQGVDPYDADRYFAGRDRLSAYRAYVEACLESVLGFEHYDALAHLGYCGKFAPFAPEECPLRWRDAPDHLDALLTALARQGRALEVNTSGYKRTPEPIPGADLLRRFAELGGEFVTLGSDAHESAYIAYRFEDAKQLALSCGLRWGVTFAGRKADPYPLEA